MSHGGLNEAIITAWSANLPHVFTFMLKLLNSFYSIVPKQEALGILFSFEIKQVMKRFSTLTNNYLLILMPDIRNNFIHNSDLEIVTCVITSKFLNILYSFRQLKGDRPEY